MEAKLCSYIFSCFLPLFYTSAAAAALCTFSIIYRFLCVYFFFYIYSTRHNISISMHNLIKWDYICGYNFFFALLFVLFFSFFFFFLFFSLSYFRDWIFVAIIFFSINFIIRIVIARWKFVSIDLCFFTWFIINSRFIFTEMIVRSFCLHSYFIYFAILIWLVLSGCDFFWSPIFWELISRYRYFYLYIWIKFSWNIIFLPPFVYL